MEESNYFRLNKYISETGFCSRREADKFVEAGAVTIDGVKAIIGMKVSEGQEVRINGKKIIKEEELVYIALNKPVGITCTTEKKINGNVVDFDFIPGLKFDNSINIFNLHMGDSKIDFAPLFIHNLIFFLVN